MAGLGAFSLRLANLDEIRATQDNLRINSSSNIYVRASATYFEGDVYFNDGRLRSSGSGISVTTNNGDFVMAPASNVVATKEITTTDGRISSVGAPLTLGSSGDILLNPSPGYVVRTNAPFVTSDGNFVSHADSKFSTTVDDLTLSPYRYLIATVPFRTTNGNITSVAPATSLDIESQQGDINLNPGGPGSKVSINGDLNSGTGRITTSDPLGLSLDGGSGNVSLTPGISGSVQINGGSVVSPDELKIFTESGNLVLAPAGNVEMEKDLLLKTGNLSSPENVPLNLSPGSGPVTVLGDLKVLGSITASGTNIGTPNVSGGIPIWTDKNAVLAAIKSPSNAYASGSGLVIAGSNYDVSPKDLSLIWRANSGGAPCWHLSGGNFWVTRKLTDGATVTYRFDIDDDTQDLVISKQVDAGLAIPVAEFNASS